jgi:DNA gyrase subunit A
MGRNAAGVKGIDLNDNECVIGVTVVTDEQSEILAITENGYGKRTEVDEYRLQGRGGKGVKTINVTEKNGNLKKLVSVSSEEDLLVVTDKGMIIRVPIDQIAKTKRSTQGVRIIHLLDNHSVATIAIVPKADIDDSIDENDETVINVIETTITEPKAPKQETEEFKEQYHNFLERELVKTEEESEEESDDQKTSMTCSANSY